MVDVTTIWKYLEEISDPEIPVISVVDLGVVRRVQLIDPETVKVFMTPTYSGCPAVNEMATAIRFKLLEKGFKNIEIVTQLSPAWTTDWMTEEGKRKLRAYGIASPVRQQHGGGLFSEDTQIPCPQCQSMDTFLVSEFGSTACKALYQCQSCKEPFDYFKCHV